MTRLWYGGTPADFAIQLGADADVVDELGVPTGTQGSAVLVPVLAQTFDLYEPDLVTPVTDLLDEVGTPITQITSETDFGARGTIPRFQGPDGYEYDLWASADAITFYRIPPSVDTLYDRVGVVETDLGDLTTAELSDVSDTLPTNGQILVFNDTLGLWEPGAAVGTGTVTSVAGVLPDGAGDVDLTPVAIGAASAADMDTVKAGMLIVLLDSGSGYPAKPPGFTHALFIGATQPVTGVTDGDVWLQPATTS